MNETCSPIGLVISLFGPCLVLLFRGFWNPWKCSLAARSMALRVCSLTSLHILSLCFLCLNKNVTIHFSLLLPAGHIFPTTMYLNLLEPEAEINLLKSILVLVFYHSNRKVTNTGLKIHIRDKEILKLIILFTFSVFLFSINNS